jgi:hypothetical protein
MYRGISISPRRGYFPADEAPPSQLEDLVSGRKSEVRELVYQTEFARLIRGEKDLHTAAAGQYVIRNRCAFP